MVDTAGLSLEQAPPVSVPFRFFFTAPLFGIGAGLLVLTGDAEMFISRWLPATLAVTHLLTIGFLSLIMVGAMLQMLPVLAGSPVPAVVAVGRLVHFTLSIGSLLIIPGFLFSEPVFMIPALLLLAGGFTIFLGAVGIALFRVRASNPSVNGMALATGALGVTLALGIAIGLWFAGVTERRLGIALVDLHLTWGIAGWMGLLLIAVSYQVVPMFQVTPEYPVGMKRFLVPFLFLGLILWSLATAAVFAGVVDTRMPVLILAAVLAGVSGFAVLTLELQRRRKRRVPDNTLLFWRIGLLSIVAASLLWVTAQWVPAIGQSVRYPVALGMLVLVGGGVAFTNGMLYKIVPFLSWFHLQNRQLARMSFSVTIPHMKRFVPDFAARQQFWLYLGALFSALFSLLWPVPFVPLFGCLFVASNVYLLANLVIAAKRYRRAFLEIEAADPKRV